VQSKHAVSYS